MKRTRIVKLKDKSCTINIVGLKITYDLEAEVFYIYLRDFKKVHRTIEPVHGIIIDLDEKDRPLGIELIWMR